MNVWDFIKRLKKNEGNTVFMTTHYMDEAEGCGRVAIIDNGCIIACAEPDELKRSLKGDTVYIKTEDDQRAAIEIETRLGVKAKRLEQGLSVIVEAGDKFIPRLTEAVSVQILSISLKKPTLDDVFINLTGKEISDGSYRPKRD